MVKCNNPDCPIPDASYPAGHNLDDVMKEWNRRGSDEKDSTRAVHKSEGRDKRY